MGRKRRFDGGRRRARARARAKGAQDGDERGPRAKSGLAAGNDHRQRSPNLIHCHILAVSDVLQRSITTMAGPLTTRLRRSCSA